MTGAHRRNIRGMIALFKSLGYKLNTRPYELNIVGVRSNSTRANSFDDKAYVFWKDDKGNWAGKVYVTTTDPGTYWLKNPMSNLGTAILKGGQYKDAYQIGLHRGQYEALVQKKPVTVIRDYDRNAVLDFNNGREVTGLFGINIHRALAKGKSDSVDKWSAGCQVFQDAQDFEDFMELAKKQRQLYGNNFTYTLVDERAFKRMVRRGGLYLILGAALLIGGYVAFRKYKNLPILPKKLFG